MRRPSLPSAFGPGYLKSLLHYLGGVNWIRAWRLLRPPHRQPPPTVGMDAGTKLHLPGAAPVPGGPRTRPHLAGPHEEDLGLQHRGPLRRSRGSPPPRRAEIPAASASKATGSDWLTGFHGDREQLRRSLGNATGSGVWNSGSAMEAGEGQKRKRKAGSADGLLSALEGVGRSGSNLLYFSRSP